MRRIIPCHALMLSIATLALQAPALAASVPFWGAKGSEPIDTPIHQLKKGQFIWMGDAVTSGPVVMVVSISEQRAYVYRNGVLIGATTVSTGLRRVFDNAALTVDAVLASTCLPSMFPAVEIDGEALWDGGYTGNPALYPLYLRTAVDDFVVIRINPLHREAVPRSARDIINRINEVSFNATFLLELRAFGLVQEILSAEGLTSHRVGRVRFHAIDADADLATLGASSKLNNEPEFLAHLFEIGRRTADAWLARHRDDIGVRATFALAPSDTGSLFETKPAAE